MAQANNTYHAQARAFQMKAYILESANNYWTYREVDGEPVGNGTGPLIVEMREIEAKDWVNLEWIAQEICRVRNEQVDRCAKDRVDW
jgi:ribonuclease HI